MRGDNSPKQSIRDYAESSDFVDSNNSKNKMDCHEFNKLNSRNDGNDIDLQVWASCYGNAHHNLTSSSLAMTVKDASTESIKIVSHAKTCGLSRNDEYKNNPCVARTASRSASWCIKRGTKEAGVLPLFLCKKREKARLSPKSVPKAYEQSEVKTAAACFSFGLSASHQPLARCVGERGGGAALFAKKCDYINENISIESRRIERVENAESLKDSIDSAESSKSNLVDCHDSATQNLAMTPKGDSAESTKIVSHAKTCGLSRNDNIGAFPHTRAKSLKSPNDSTTHSKPKLLHLASDLHSGGAERVFYNTIEQTLKTNSYEIFIASADKTIPFNINKSHFLRLDDWNAYSKVRGVCKYIFNLRNYRLLKRFLFTHKIDIIHTQNYLSRLSPSVLFSLRKFKRKFPQTRLIFTQHGYGVCANLCLYNYAKNAICESCIGKSKLRIAIDNCDRRGKIYSFLKALRVPFYQGVFLKEQNLFDKIIFVSEFQSKKHILEGYKSTAVIANPIEHRFYNPHIKVEDKQNLIVFFGRIAKEKNIPLLIRSFVRFTKTHKNYKLLIIGNGDEKDKCQRLAEELLVAESQGDSSDCVESGENKSAESLKDSIDSSDSKITIDCHDSATQNLAMTPKDDFTNPTNPTASQITFIPHLSPDELKDILKLAKITVLPSLLYETFGLSIVESVLSGAVPIVSNIGALSETIERYYGVAFENGDEVSLANAMEAVVCEYERHFKDLLQARSKIISDIECKKYVSDLINAYML